MGNIHLITGYAGQAHVSASDQGAFHLALFGDEQFVFGKGNRLSASVITNNQIRVLDGDIYMQGRYIRLQEELYVDLTVENGEQGYLRHDLIVARYTKDEVTGVEDCNLVVIKGVHAPANPADPEYVVGDIINSHAAQNDMPLYKVSLDGLDIVELTPLFTVKTETIRDIVADLATKQTETDRLNEDATIEDGDFFPLYAIDEKAHKKTLWSTIKGTLAEVFSDINHTHSPEDVGASASGHTHTPEDVGAAAAEHEHDASDITRGILDVARGGTGVETLEALAELLGTGGGGAQIATGEYKGTGTYGGSNPLTLPLPFKPKLLIVMADYEPIYGSNHIYGEFIVWIANAPLMIRVIYDNGSTARASYNTYVTHAENSISFYGSDSRLHLNDDSFRYYWLAVG